MININKPKFNNLLPKNNEAGGNIQEWKIENDIEAIFSESLPLRDLTMEEYLNVILKKINRTDFPITLDPSNATFEEVAIHAILRQRLKKSTVVKRITYARFMELHNVPVDFRKPTYENFIRHMDYREQMESAGYGALGREWDTMKTFLRAYGISIKE